MALNEIDEVDVNLSWLETNMVWVNFQAPAGNDLVEFAAGQGVRLSVNADNSCRLVTHHDVAKADIDTVVELIKAWFAR